MAAAEKTSGARARAEASENNSHTSNDTFANPSIAVLENTDTVSDANGIERIISPIAQEFTPAPMEASEQEIKAAEEREQMFANAAKKRQGDNVGEPAVNNPGDGGSQAST